MYAGNRRQFLRVTFESTFEVKTKTWTDKTATGLDISLSGCRFHCEQSLSEGETISIFLKSGFELKGNVIWCWPIEWYYMAAVHFEKISNQEQEQLKNYIEDVTGENYQMEKEDEEKISDDSNEEKNDFDLDDVENINDLNFDVVGEDQNEDETKIEKDNDLDDLPPLDEKDLLETYEETADENTSSIADISNQDDFLHTFAEGDLSPHSFNGKNIILFDLEKEQSEILYRYLSERIGMEVECVTKKQNLWRHLKLDPLNLVILESGSAGLSDPLEVMQQTKDQFPEVNYICISGPVSLERRIQFLNAGALDYLTRPIHLSTIAQSILLHLSRIDFYKKEQEENDKSISEFNNTSIERQSNETSETFHDEDLTGTLDLLEEDLNVSQEIELVDEEF